MSVTDLRDAKAAILAERAFHIIGTIAEAGFKKWTVVSGSRPGKRHKVEHNEHGWTCGCEDFKKHRASTCYHIRAVKRFLSDLENGRTPGESVRPVPSNPHTSTDFYAGARRRKRKPVTINGKSESTLRRHARAARPGREYEIMFELLNAYTLYQGGK